MGKSSAQMLLLSKFRTCNSLDRYRDDEDWEGALQQKVQIVIDQFLNDGVLQPAGLKEKLDYKFKAIELQSLLKASGLKISGRKEELIQRLIGNDPQAMQEATSGLDLYLCTEVGTRLVDNFLEGEKAKQDAAEREVLGLLEKREFSKAVHVMAQFEASQVFPRGVGIDWKNYNVESEVTLLKAIFGRVPGILKGIDKTRLDRLRLAAAVMELWGTTTVEGWLPDDFETGSYLDCDTSCRMLLFHAQHLRRMADYREARVKTVKVSSVNDGDTCSECQTISGKKFRLDNTPELPYAKCTCEIGCRCIAYVAESWWDS
jgi:hypothetical protein